jgi:hypothetical protein
MSRRESMRQLRSQRSMNILDARICLPQQLLEAELGVSNAQYQSFGAGDLARLPEVRHYNRRL